jgi:sigma-B regulation protein RsbU (phosphoserine phosphatase)
MAAQENNATTPVDRSVERQLADRTEALQTIFDLSDWFAGAADLQEVLNATAERVARVMGMKACGIRLLDEDHGELAIQAAYNLSDEYLQKGPVRISENPIDAAALSGETVYLADAWKDPRVRYPKQAKAEGLVSGLCAPMTYRGQTIGVIRVYSDKPHQSTEQDHSFLRSAGTQAAAGIIEARLIAEQRQADRHMRQLRYAGDVQRRMIPARPPEHSWATFGCVYDPSLAVGGDFFDFIELSRGALGLSMADVVGKGIPAALMMASVRSALRAHASVVSDVRTTVARVNRHMCRDTRAGEFATVFYGIFAAEERRLDYVNAGHDPPLLLRADEFTELSTGGIAIGILPEAGFENGFVELLPDDIVVFYTDGVIDAMNFDGECFGRDRLRQSIRRYRDQAAATLAWQILWDTRRFAGLAEQNDDISVVVAKVL